MTEKLWVVVPAAGVGRRMSEEIPKQYLPLASRTVLEHALDSFLKRADIAGIVIALAADDHRFVKLTIVNDARIRTVIGGANRADSVLNGLNELLACKASDEDWVLVHDAARPCLHPDDLERLISELRNDAVGGLLAVPMADTLKKSESERVAATMSRENVWRALTPQMFRLGPLRRALQEADGKRVTDESSALELLGLKPRLIVGRADNIKITVSEDLPLAEFILRERRKK